MCYERTKGDRKGSSGLIGKFTIKNGVQFESNFFRKLFLFLFFRSLRDWLFFLFEVPLMTNLICSHIMPNEQKMRFQRITHFLASTHDINLTKF